MTNQVQLLGGWSHPESLTNEDIALFNLALSNQVGAIYNPFFVSKQVVKGTNYSFLCTAKILCTPSFQIGFAVVTFFVDLDGNINNLNIQTYGMVPQSETGSWAEATALDDKAKEVFESVSTIGVNYVPYLVSTQLVAGTNYRYFCIANTMTFPAKSGLAIVTIYQDLSGSTAISNIETFGLFDNESQNTINNFTMGYNNAVNFGDYANAASNGFNIANSSGKYVISIPCGPIWNDDDAKNKCPAVCASRLGRWTGAWRTVVWGKMSTCDCELDISRTGSSTLVINVVAGPIWNEQDAKEKCPTICASYGGEWTGNWHTPAETWGKMSVCECRIKI